MNTNINVFHNKKKKKIAHQHESLCKKNKPRCVFYNFFPRQSVRGKLAIEVYYFMVNDSRMFFLKM